MTIVVDASAAIASLVDAGAEGTWARRLLSSDELAAPHLMSIEAANILRRHELRGVVTTADASVAIVELMQLPVVLFSLQGFSERVWELRQNVTAYDAWYVALSEALRAPLATLDHNLARSPGPRCEFLLPPR
jgi:predicted nucleic acid-binding protein